MWGTQGLFPDLVILLHLEPERGLLRSTEAPDRMEMEGQDFHTKVADAYLKIAEEHPERFVVVEADRAPARSSTVSARRSTRRSASARTDQDVEPLRAVPSEDAPGSGPDGRDEDAGPAASSGD